MPLLGVVYGWARITPDQLASQNLGITPINRRCVSLILKLFRDCVRQIIQV